MTFCGDAVATMAAFCWMLPYLSMTLPSAVRERLISSLSALAPVLNRLASSSWNRIRRKDNVPPNHIMEVLPPELLKDIFGMLPASYRFVAPVCRRFRDVYVESRKNPYRTCVYSIVSEAALQLILDEEGYRGSSRNESLSYIGAWYGRIDWLERGGVFDERMCHWAAAGGKLHVLKYLRGRGCPWDNKMCWAAAMKGNLEVLQWARAEGCELDEKTCFAAAYGGHLKVLEWARGEGCDWGRWRTCKEAAIGGHLKLLKWAINNGCPYYEGDFDDITDPNFVYVESRKNPYRTCVYSIVSEAALQLILDEERDEISMIGAGGGRIDLVISYIGARCGRIDWLVRGGVFDERMCRAAAAGGKLHVLKYLRGRGCPWDSKTCWGAAMNGNLEVLQWARKEG
eukprot:CAMPEP_0194346626 /NCGR_PEP_ID=MMETSP0171-20130528/105531_1 /TAXON_ID=218684 /ORGANISM="Corethron pennatum, Strain L29A3" /LENGTH=398 /DNA_ID=CAMNT_0039113773 /DNA_START=106 /DNA_END=1299 /DNA_ORIENTATION=-